MNPRITIHNITDYNSLLNIVYLELESISRRKPQHSVDTQNPLLNCCQALFHAGAVTILAQHRVHDPDFLAEYSSYYSKQFTEVTRLCTRLHFFKETKAGTLEPIEYIDSTPPENYLGFITLRPVIMSPVGASILSSEVATGFIRSADVFPVHIMGKLLSVCGTPFMQQDNAVGACAQASIWMALRTLRKREGDRAHDPAQITDAATRYNANGRIKPNRQGLTQIQMMEAIRSAGYSPHSIWLGQWHNQNLAVMNAADVEIAKQNIHPYIESEIPVVLLLIHKNGGHAVVAVGHTWDANIKEFKTIEVSNSASLDLKFVHAISWIPEFIINNDNSGPYMKFPPSAGGGTGYSMEQMVYAMPLLPSDVFMSGEEALSIGLTVISDLYQGFATAADKKELEQSALEVAIRILLVEKRKLRKWAAKTTMPKELQDELRMMDLPKRVWVLELHLKAIYGDHGKSNIPSLVGFVLIDPTGDTATNSILMFYLNKNYPLDIIDTGSFIQFIDGLPKTGTQTTDTTPLEPIRN